jgi:hypothetical protein
MPHDQPKQDFDMTSSTITTKPEAVIRAREVLVAFLITFISARILVYLIMAHKIADLYLHLGGAHVHHLNYGIFLLSFVGAFLLFAKPTGDWMTLAALVYGVGLALTFDEFGMWLHLGGAYWQRASFDAVVIIAAFLSLIAAAPELRRFRPQHWLTAIVLLMFIGGFFFTVHVYFQHLDKSWAPRLEELENNQPL